MNRILQKAMALCLILPLAVSTVSGTRPSKDGDEGSEREDTDFGAYVQTVQSAYATEELRDLIEDDPPTPEPHKALDEHEPILQFSEDFVNQYSVKTYLGRYFVTGYDICLECCGKLDGITASGAMAEVGRTVAASKEIPFGTTLYIDGIGERVVEDRGGMVTENTLDVFCVDHHACYAITGWYDVYIVEGGETEWAIEE